MSSRVKYSNSKPPIISYNDVSWPTKDTAG